MSHCTWPSFPDNVRKHTATCQSDYCRQMSRSDLSSLAIHSQARIIDHLQLQASLCLSAAKGQAIILPICPSFPEILSFWCDMTTHLPQINAVSTRQQIRAERFNNPRRVTDNLLIGTARAWPFCTWPPRYDHVRLPVHLGAFYRSLLTFQPRAHFSVGHCCIHTMSPHLGTLPGLHEPRS